MGGTCSTKGQQNLHILVRKCGGKVQLVNPRLGKLDNMS